MFRSRWKKLLQGLHIKKVKWINHTNEDTRATVDGIFNVILEQTWNSQTVDFMHHFDTTKTFTDYVDFFPSLVLCALNINFRWEFCSYLLMNKSHKSTFASNYFLINFFIYYYRTADAPFLLDRKEVIHSI